MKIIDMHCDTITRLDKETRLRSNELQLDLLRMSEHNVALQNFAIFLDKENETTPYETCHHFIDIYQQELTDNSDLIAPVLTFQDYLENQKAGKMSGLLTMEEGAPIGDTLHTLHEFYERGVRMLTLTWNYENAIGFPNMMFADNKKERITSRQKGLTSFGTDLVKAMNEMGMIIDVSHGSDQLVKDVLTHTSAPFVASHSNVREECFHSRNLPNDLIKEIANRGGVMGINFSRDFLTKQPQESLIDAIVRHITAFKKIGGIECVGLGSDFDGIPIDPELADISKVELIHTALTKAGFSQNECEKIFFGNVERLYQEIL